MINHDGEFIVFEIPARLPKCASRIYVQTRPLQCRYSPSACGLLAGDCSVDD
jgi:hypothetical protein